MTAYGEYAHHIDLSELVVCQNIFLVQITNCWIKQVGDISKNKMNEISETLLNMKTVESIKIRVNTVPKIWPNFLM